jgi:hypothetical protein
MRAVVVGLSYLSLLAYAVSYGFEYLVSVSEDAAFYADLVKEIAGFALVVAALIYLHSPAGRRGPAQT